MGMMNLQTLRALGSMLTNRALLSSAMGAAFGGARNYYEVLGYPQQLQFSDMMAKYTRQGISSRVVDAPAAALWDRPPIVKANDEEWNQAWDRLIVRHNLWTELNKVDRLAGLGRYSTLFIGVNDGKKVNLPSKRREKGQKLCDVLYFQPYSQESAKIDSYNQDTQSEYYMLPEFYTLNPVKQNEFGVSQSSGPSMSSIKVHRSRILHVAENCLENKIFGFPRLERVFNDLEDLVKVTGGTAETFWLTANRGMQVDIDKEMELSESDATNLSEELDEYQHQLRRVLRTRGVKITNLGSETPDPTGVFGVIVAMISGSTGIPKRILLGSEAGSLASEQDRANWAERVESRRVEFGEPVIILPLISQLTNMGVLPNIDSLEVTITWPDAFVLSPLEIAQKSAQHARSATNFASAIDKLVKLKQGTPGTPGATDAEGKTIPGTEVPAVAGEDWTDIIQVPWMQKMLGQDPIKPQINDPEDLKAPTGGSGQSLESMPSSAFDPSTPADSSDTLS